MKNIARALLLCFLIILTACSPTEVDQQSDSEILSKPANPELNLEEVLSRQQKVYADAEASPQQFKENLKESCPHYGDALLTTAETIQLGTRVFNAGGVSLTKRIYEGTVYKILFNIKDDCMDLSDALQVGLANANESEDHHDQAWALRNALDLIMGGPPTRPPGAQ